MITITAVIRAKPGTDATMRDALLAVADNTRKEPGTVDFFVSQDPRDRCVFTTYERFADREAMDRHNTSEAVARFFTIAAPILEGEVTLLTTDEIFAKR